MIVVITGVGRRLGLELAHHFLSAGHRVVGTYRTRYEAVDTLADAGADLSPLELTDPEAVRYWAEQVRDRYTHIDVLIHNASAFTPTKSDPGEAADQFGQFFSVHMQAPFIINEVLTPALQASPERHANLIHITDIYVHRPSPENRSYCATKAGLQSLNDSYAQWLAPKVRVNAIQPGPLAFLPEHSDEAKEKVMASTPLQELGGFGPIVKTVDYILDNDYLTGTSIPVDGGRRWVM